MQKVFYAGLDEKGDNLSLDWTGDRLNIYAKEEEARARHPFTRKVEVVFKGAAKASK